MAFHVPDYIYRVTLDRVIDGDTIDVHIDLGFKMSAFKRLRLLEIDTDEKRGGTAATKLRAKMAQARITELLGMGEIYIKTKMDATGKYGRLLAWPFVKDGEDDVIDINATLVLEGYQKGGTGTEFTDELVRVNIDTSMMPNASI